jgi:hypothetical protein
MSGVEKLLRSYDQEAVERGMSDLRKLPVDEAFRILEQLAVEADPEYRCCAMDGMALVSPERAEEFAIQLLIDPHEAVRGYACDVLGRLKSPRIVPLSAQLLTTDPEDLVRHRAVYWLGELGDESALQVLMAAAARDVGADHEGTPIREHAVKAIRKIQARLASER